jgi:hypothetical protein
MNKVQSKYFIRGTFYDIKILPDYLKMISLTYYDLSNKWLTIGKLSSQQKKYLNDLSIKIEDIKKVLKIK